MISVKFDNGRFWQSEGERRVALWTSAACRKRIAERLETLSTKDKEAEEQILEFWRKAAAYAESKGSEEDRFAHVEAVNNFLILEHEWNRYFGEEHNLVFVL